jgi:light-regulated signal transduction histidine kinase (bacteriophytochrome)
VQRRIEPSVREKELSDRISALEAEIAVYRQAVENSRQEMQGFAYSVSHDLRAPLRAIEGFSKILLEDFRKQLEPEAQRFLQHITSNTQTLTSQIDDLLRYYRYGKNPPSKIKVDADAICREAIDLASPRRQPNVLISGKLPEVEADPIQLREIFTQLIENALKFSSRADSPSIEVGAKVEPNATTFHVRDNGVGFDPRNAERLFQVFQKLHSATEYPGNGIGLAIVKRLVQAHGGCVAADAAPDNGATFYFTLPKFSGNGAAR